MSEPASPFQAEPTINPKPINDICPRCGWDKKSDPLNLNICDECFNNLKSDG